jgi:hypothetical protein
MELKSFINYNKNCLVCNTLNILTVNGSIQETIDDITIQCIYIYMSPVIRKEFITFANANVAIYCADEFLDLDTLNKNKYATCTIKKDGYVVFDEDFNYKMRLNLKVFCPDGHYSYNSRAIRVSNISPDITKGFPVISESLMNEQYAVVSDKKKNTTTIYNNKSKCEPVVIKYMDITSFPYNDDEKLTKKISNILLLA